MTDPGQLDPLVGPRKQVRVSAALGHDLALVVQAEDETRRHCDRRPGIELGLVVGVTTGSIRDPTAVAEIVHDVIDELLVGQVAVELLRLFAHQAELGRPRDVGVVDKIERLVAKRLLARLGAQPPPVPPGTRVIEAFDGAQMRHRSVGRRQRDQSGQPLGSQDGHCVGGPRTPIVAGQQEPIDARASARSSTSRASAAT